MNQELVFYGTGAAEAIPSPFCSCRVCRHAREQGGNEVRRRSMFRVNEAVCLDLGPDAAMQAMQFGDLTQLRHALFTHTHLDHFAYDLLETRGMAYERGGWPLRCYLTDKAYDMVEQLQTSAFVGAETKRLLDSGIMEFCRLEYGQTVNLEGVEVTPLRGNHVGQVGENSANYLLKLENGVTLYYGLDTGWYLPETMAFLSGRPLDVLISECTFGLTEGRGEHPDGHLDAFACEKLFQALAEQGTLTPHSRVYLTHINHYTSTGAELEAWLRERRFPCPVTLAWDGLTIGAQA